LVERGEARQGDAEGKMAGDKAYRGGGGAGPASILKKKRGRQRKGKVQTYVCEWMKGGTLKVEKSILVGKQDEMEGAGTWPRIRRR